MTSRRMNGSSSKRLGFCGIVVRNGGNKLSLDLGLGHSLIIPNDYHDKIKEGDDIFVPGRTGGAADPDWKKMEVVRCAAS